MAAVGATTGKKKKGSHAGPRSWAGVTSGRMPLSMIYSLEPMKRIAMVREGAPSAFVEFLVNDMAITRDRLYRIAGVARATIDRKVRARTRLNQDETERLIGVALLVGQAEKIVSESGDPRNFDAGRWVASWLDRPSATLGGIRPGTLMDTAEGRELVADSLGRMQSGAYG